MLSSRSPWRKYMELRPLSPLVRPVVPDGGFNDVIAGCSVSVSQVIFCCAFASKCTRVLHTTSARLQSILDTRIVLQDLSQNLFDTRNKICWACLMYTPPSIAFCACAQAIAVGVVNAGYQKRKLALSDLIKFMIESSSSIYVLAQISVCGR